MSRSTRNPIRVIYQPDYIVKFMVGFEMFYTEDFLILRAAHINGERAEHAIPIDEVISIDFNNELFMQFRDHKH